jgi:hypothetical protein
MISFHKGSLFLDNVYVLLRSQEGPCSVELVTSASGNQQVVLLDDRRAHNESILIETLKVTLLFWRSLAEYANLQTLQSIITTTSGVPFSYPLWKDEFKIKSERADDSEVFW